MENILVSIIVPVYNSEKYLEECILSVINQTYSNWELILIDDGSTDNSACICERYSEINKRIKTYHKSNEGPFCARLFGVSKSMGDYCMFLDSDDTFYEDALESILPYCNDGYDLVQFSYSKNKNRNKLNDFLKFDSTNIHEFQKMVLLNRASSMPCKCIKSSILKFDDLNKEINRGKFAEDLEYTLYIVDHVNNAIFLKKDLFNYRDNETSTTHSINFFTFPKTFDFEVFSLQKNYCQKWLGDLSLFEQEIKKYWLSFCYILLLKSFRNEYNGNYRIKAKTYLNVSFFGIYNNEIFKNIKKLDMKRFQKNVLLSYFKKRKIAISYYKLLFFYRFSRENRNKL